MYFKDLALFVFDFDGLHQGILCFLKITSCKRVELPYISIFEFFSYCMHKCKKKFPHNVRQADSFARSYHSKVAPLISELNWKVKNHGTLRRCNIEIDWITDHSICLVKTYTSCQSFHWASLPLVRSGMHDMTLKRVFTLSKGETCVSEKREDCFVRLYQQWVYILKV